jgi:hypothetical protein
MVAVRSTRRYGLAEKFWIVSEKTLLFPTIVRTRVAVVLCRMAFQSMLTSWRRLAAPTGGMSRQIMQE